MSKTTSDADISGAIPLEQAALNEWRRIIIQHDWDALRGLLTDDVTYHNPSQAEPLRGKDAFVGTLRLVFSIFEDFEYARHFHGEEGQVLEFRGKVGDAAFTGIDILCFDATGKIIDLVVMMRPIAAIMKLGEEAARRMAAADPAAQE